MENKKPKKQMCRKGKHCQNIKNPPLCKMEHQCRFKNNCTNFKSKKGCFYIHLPPKNLLKQYQKKDLDHINLDSLEDLLQNVTHRDLQYFLQIFARIVNSDKQAMKINIIKIISRTQILEGRRLNQFREGIKSQRQIPKQMLELILKNLHYWNFGLKKILQYQGQECHALCVGEIASLVGQLQERVLAFSSSLKEEQFDVFYKKYKTLKQEVEDLLRQWRGRDFSHTSHPRNLEQAKSQGRSKQLKKKEDNFRQITINPTIYDLKRTTLPQLKELNFKGSFDNLDDYLDRNFKLLREDFISRLRQGLQHQLKSPGERTRATYIYPRVKLFYFFAEKGYQVMKLRFHFTRINRGYSWNRAKKLMYGSLILLSSDNFETIYLAVIRDRDGMEMNDTYKNYHYVDISIEFVKDLKIEPVTFYEKHSHQTFVVIESKAYYEAYYHNLKILQEINHLPFTRLLVNVDFSKNHRPEYIGQSDIEQVKLHMLKNGTFDDSQQKAIMSCFDRSFTLIQGPPGTGKTYIGAHVVNLLLKAYLRNQEEKKIEFHQPKKPIYVVCYTNHALDQFIEKFEPFTSSIIRIGGQSKKFRDYELDNTRFKKNLKRPGDYYDLKDKFNQYLAEYQAKSQIMFHNIHLKVLDPALCKQFYLLQQIKKQYKQQLAVEALMIRTLWGQNFYKIFQKQALKMHEMYRIPEVFHWLGLLRFEEMKINCFSKQIKNYSKENEEDEELKKTIIEDEEAIEDQMQYYQERIHSHRFFYEYERMEDLLNLKKGIFHKDKTMRQLIEENFSASEELLRKRKLKNPLKFLEKYQRPYDLRIQERWFVNLEIVKQENLQLKQSLHGLVGQMKERKAHFEDIDMDLRKRALQLVRVVAMTTTGAAKYKSLLKQVNAEIMIVEEAAEVLESHLITAITPSMKHIILIGDHQQLRPPMNVYQLGRDYNFDISMFQRLINNDFDYCMLKHQRRMRPEIADLTRIIYPELKDAEAVKNYPRIAYLDNRNLFFFNHEYPEHHNESLESKQNSNEALIVLNFAHFLIEEAGYQGTQITILTLYSAQLLLLRHFRRIRFDKERSMGGINIQTVDNYQGEQNDIVLLSLVRSNDKDEIGFLQITNRVCVAFSRAKYGFFIFGNAKCLKRSYQKIKKRKNKYLFNVKDIWNRIFDALEQKKAIIDIITIKCQCHGTIVKAKTPDDFKLLQSFCVKTCNNVMDCGHKCQKVCHIIEAMKDSPNGHSLCFKLCERKHPCGHPCKYKCRECSAKLQPCKTVVSKALDCGHKINVICSEVNNQFQCDKKCNRILPCGHQCKKLCKEQCLSLSNVQKQQGKKSPCKFASNIDLPCGHQVKISCGENVDIQAKFKSCQQPCLFQNACGHHCPKKCRECRAQPLHETCTQQCLKPRNCGHPCMGTCETCPPCQEKCRLGCPHTRCQKLCFQECNRCELPCANKCKHSKCSRLCWQLCNREPCNKPCQEVLKCGHKCLGFCGQPCPNVCRQCNPSDINFSILKKNYKPQEERFVFLADCGHSILSSLLDKRINDTVESGDHYTSCPICKALIFKCPRYSNQLAILKMRAKACQEFILQEKKKFISDHFYKELGVKLEKIQRKFSQEFREILKRIRNRLSNTLIYKSTSQLSTLINAVHILISVGDLIERNSQAILAKQPMAGLDYIIKGLNLESPPKGVMDALIKGYNLLVVYCQIHSGRWKPFPSLKEQVQSVLIGHPKNFSQYIEMLQQYKTMVGSEHFEAQIMKIVNFPQTTWYQCKKGHIISIVGLKHPRKRACLECSETSWRVMEII